MAESFPTLPFSMLIEGGHNMYRKTMFWILSASLLLAISCSKLTTENYDRLEIGMDYDEVVAIFGEADECGGAMGIKSCTWGDDKKYVVVNFAGDKVIMFSGQGL